MGAVSREAEARERAENRAAGVAILVEELSGVTPAMLEAGSRVSAMFVLGMIEPPNKFITAIWRAMLAAKLRGQGT